MLTVIFAGATFWFAPRLPMVDLPQHAAQVAVWHDLLLGTSKWEPLLYINYFTPYLVGYGLTLLLSFVLPISAAMKLLLALAYYAFVASCVALRGRLGGDRRMDWLFIPGFFGYAYGMGLYTFLIAAPLGVLFIFLAHRYADRPTPMLGIVLGLADVVLFFSHGLVFLFANCIGGLILLMRRRSLLRLLIAGLPYLAVGVLILAYVLVRLTFEAERSAPPIDIIWGWDLNRLNFLIFSTSWPIGESVSADWTFGPPIMLGLAAPLVLGAKLNRGDPAAFVPFLVTIVVWLFVPLAAMNTWLLYQRFAVFLLPFYALMFTAPRSVRSSLLSRLWLPLLCWTFLAIYVERLRAFAKESAAFEDVLAAVQPGHRALGLIFYGASPAAANLAYFHYPLWYQAEKGGFVDFNFAGYLPQVVRYRSDRAPAVFGGPVWTWQAPDAFDWRRNQAELYRYFFVRHIAPLPQGYFPTDRCKPVLLKAAATWSVYENVNCYFPFSKPSG